MIGIKACFFQSSKARQNQHSESVEWIAVYRRKRGQIEGADQRIRISRSCQTILTGAEKIRRMDRFLQREGLKNSSLPFRFGGRRAFVELSQDFSRKVKNI